MNEASDLFQKDFITLDNLFAFNIYISTLWYTINFLKCLCTNRVGNIHQLFPFINITENNKVRKLPSTMP